MSEERHPWRVKYDGTCVRCGRSLVAGTPAIYDRSARTIRCIECPTATESPAEAPLPQSEIDTGTAGASARREFERRRSNREQRIRQRFGQRFGGALLAVTSDPQSTRAWARGAEGEERLAEVLADIGAIVALHDRRVPATRGNIDHLVIAPAGVFVIDAKRYEGEVRIRDRGSFFRSDERLYVGRRDCSRLADGLGWQVEAVHTALAASQDHAGVPVTAVLCFVGSDWPLLFPPSEFRGVRLESPRSLPRLLVAAAATPIDVDRVARGLAAEFPPKSE